MKDWKAEVDTLRGQLKSVIDERDRYYRELTELRRIDREKVERMREAFRAMLSDAIGQ